MVTGKPSRARDFFDGLNMNFRSEVEVILPSLCSRSDLVARLYSLIRSMLRMVPGRRSKKKSTRSVEIGVPRNPEENS